MKPTAAEAEILELVTQQDRQYFLDHPGVKQYRRPYIPGEVPGHTMSKETFVIVTRIASDLRIRDVREPFPGGESSRLNNRHRN